MEDYDSMDNSVFLEFTLVDNFLWNVNKDGYYSLSGMTTDGDDYNFIPVTNCDINGMSNINTNGRLNDNVVLMNKTDAEYPAVKLLAQRINPCGLMVTVASSTNTLSIGEEQQNLKGLFIVHKDTETVVAYCILSESIPVKNYLTIPYEGAVVEIRPVTHIE